MSSDNAHNSGATPASSAPCPSAEESGATPEGAAGETAPAPTPAEEGARGPAASPADHEQQLERDLDELAAKAEKADEYLELARRTRADFDNYRRRAAREAAAAQERGVIKLVKELLPAVDNLDRAVQAITTNGGSAEELASGVKLVHKELVAALSRAGVELYSPAGERFDPECHEAVAQQPVDGAEPGTVIEVYQRGCRLGDWVIRPARVVVSG